ncbi:FMO3 monooxygenase, partial [Rhinopomastus cyanomelas]|nr:FMO3 monooxygenase [Rhinopomastus cyanomelas]
FSLSYDEVLKTDCLVYMDKLTSFVIAKPSVLVLLFRDPQLAFTIFFDVPCTPYQYWLWGPACWAGACEAILTERDRTLKPTRIRVHAGSFIPCPSPLIGVAFFLLLAALIFGFQ